MGCPHNLEWIVRHMSWAAPWIETDAPHGCGHTERTTKRSRYDNPTASCQDRVGDNDIGYTAPRQEHDSETVAGAQAIPRVPHPRDVERRPVRTRIDNYYGVPRVPAFRYTPNRRPNLPVVPKGYKKKSRFLKPCLETDFYRFPVPNTP